MYQQFYQNFIKIEHKSSPNENGDRCSYIRLYRAVINQLMIDLKTNSKRKKPLQYKAKAEKYVKENQHELKKLCEIANCKFSEIVESINFINSRKDNS